jgi:hypothetical protein
MRIGQRDWRRAARDRQEVDFSAAKENIPSLNLQAVISCITPSAPKEQSVQSRQRQPNCSKIAVSGPTFDA